MLSFVWIRKVYDLSVSLVEANALYYVLKVIHCFTFGKFYRALVEARNGVCMYDEYLSKTPELT